MALDIPDMRSALSLADAIGDAAGFYKVGLDDALNAAVTALTSLDDGDLRDLGGVYFDIPPTLTDEKFKKEVEALGKTVKDILAKPVKPAKSPKKMPPMKEQRKRWKLIDGVMVEAGIDDAKY